MLIAHLRGVARAHDWLKDARKTGPLSVSAISVAETTGGMRSGKRRQVWTLLSLLRVEPVTEVVARRGGELRRQFCRSHTGISLPDYLIAATAEVRGLELATLNVRDFPMFANLRPPFSLRDS